MRDNLGSEYGAVQRLPDLCDLNGQQYQQVSGMEHQVRNAYFSQWVDALELAQKDRSLKYVTVSVVDSMPMFCPSGRVRCSYVCRMA